MAKMNTFVRDDVLPSWWANSIQEHVAGLIANLRLTLLNSTTVRATSVSSDAADVQAAIGVDGLWRRAAVNVDRAHPGGAAGKYDIFATAKNNSIVGVPLPGTDTTDYVFAMAIVATGGSPAVVPGTVDVFRKVGECWWDGAQITRLEPWTGDRRPGLDPLVAGTPLATITPLVVQGMGGQSAPLLSAGLNSTADDRMVLAPAGQLRLPVTGINGGLLLGGDASLYRSGAGALTTPGALTVGGLLSAASPAFTGVPTAPTAAPGTNTTQLATTAWVVAQGYALTPGGSGYATLASPAFTGVPTGPTATVDTNTGQLATTAFVLGQASAVNPLINGPVAVGSSLRYARADHVHPVDTSRAPLASPTFTGTVAMPVLQHSGASLGFYGAAPVARSGGWGVALATNFAGATTRKSLTAAFTDKELRDVVASILDALRTYGLMGA